MVDEKRVTGGRRLRPWRRAIAHAGLAALIAVMTSAPSPAARAAPPAPRPAPAVAMGEVPRVVLGLYDGAFGDYRFSH